jgi:hypothetical protein
MKKTGLTAAVALAALVFFVSHAATSSGAHAAQLTNNCDPSDHIDRSTIDTAKQKFHAARYTHLHDMTKGCDNYWHARGMKHGNKMNIVLSPHGKIMTEGD